MTPRQTEVLTLIVSGHGSKAIAGILKLSPKTIDKHRFDLMSVLDLHNTVLLTLYAVSKKLVDPLDVLKKIRG
jgi:DNA-binding NarL/FixJ family response regulator